jgi:hypothetical protein
LIFAFITVFAVKNCKKAVFKGLLWARRTWLCKWNSPPLFIFSLEESPLQKNGEVETRACMTSHQRSHEERRGLVTNVGGHDDGRWSVVEKKGTTPPQQQQHILETTNDADATYITARRAPKSQCTYGLLGWVRLSHIW